MTCENKVSGDCNVDFYETDSSHFAFDVNMPDVAQEEFIRMINSVIKS
jgi:hypothetical protein